MALAQAVEPGATDGPDHVYDEPVRHGGRGRLDWKCDVGRARGSRLCEPVPGENEDREQSTGDNEHGRARDVDGHLSIVPGDVSRVGHVFVKDVRQRAGRPRPEPAGARLRHEVDELLPRRNESPDDLGPVDVRLHATRLSS